MTNSNQNRNLPEDTVWSEKVSWVDSIPRSVGMGLVLFVFIFIWWAISSSGFVPSIILPTPMETLYDLIFVTKNIWNGEYIASALWTTLRTVFFGYLLSITIGFSLGILVGETAFGERSVMPLLVGLDPNSASRGQALACRAGQEPDVKLI